MIDRLSVATFRDTNAAYGAASAIKSLKDCGLSEFKLKAVSASDVLRQARATTAFD